MKILFLSHYSKLYGANLALLEILENMKLRGIESVVICPVEGDLTQKLKEINIKYYVINTKNCVFYKKKIWLKKIRIYRKNILNNIAAYKIIKICKKEKIDIIHSNSSVINVGGIVHKKLGVKHIWHIREFGEEDYNLEYDYGFKKMAEFIENNSNKIIAISNSIMEKYKPNLENKNKLNKIYDGIDINKYDITKSNRYNKDNKLTILFVGRVQETKNQYILVQAINILVNKLNKNNVLVYIVGSGDKEYIDKINKYINDNKLNNYVKLEGHKNNINEYLDKSNVGIIASNKEAFGRVTIEYILGKLCVIASDSGASKEILGNNYELLFKLDNVDDLVNKIQSIYDNKSNMEYFTDKLYREVKNKFSIERNVDDLIKVYKSVLSEE